MKLFYQGIEFFLRATSNQQPATSNQQPATSNQQPATSNQQPATSNQQPATSNQQPATSNQQPATSNQQPDLPSYPQNKPNLKYIFQSIHFGLPLTFFRMREMKNIETATQEIIAAAIDLLDCIVAPENTVLIFAEEAKDFIFFFSQSGSALLEGEFVKLIIEVVGANVKLLTWWGRDDGNLHPAKNDPDFAKQFVLVKRLGDIVFSAVGIAFHYILFHGASSKEKKRYFTAHLFLIGVRPQKPSILGIITSRMQRS